MMKTLNLVLKHKWYDMIDSWKSHATLTLLAKRVNHIVAKGDIPVWPKGSKSRGFSTASHGKGINTGFMVFKKANQEQEMIYIWNAR